MDHYQCIQMKDSEDIAILKIFVEKERIFEFFANLNLEFDQVQVQVLGKGDLPSLNETISIIRVEEGKRGVMLNETPTLESSARLSNAGNMKNVGAENHPNAANKRPNSSKWCNYCKKLGHAKDMCWNLHGRPPNFNNNNRGWRPSGKQQQKGQGQANLTNSNPPSNENETPTHGEFKEDILLGYWGGTVTIGNFCILTKVCARFVEGNWEVSL